MDYALDFGNTQIKCGEFDGDQLGRTWIWSTLKLAAKDLKGLNIGRVIISSVTGNPEELTDILGQTEVQVLHFDRKTPVPLVNNYRSPETLGMDRLAAACGARAYFPDKPCLIIDFGTCITYDFLTEDGIFEGGTISPGMRMRYRAMKTFTKDLPYLEDVPKNVSRTGKTTAEAMHSGVSLGIEGEIDLIIGLYQRDHPRLQVVITGGDASYFESRIKAPKFAAPNLVLEGLNSILKFNEVN